MKKNIKDKHKKNTCYAKAGIVFYKKNTCYTKAGIVFYKKNIGKSLPRGTTCIGSTNTF